MTRSMMTATVLLSIAGALAAWGPADQPTAQPTPAAQPKPAAPAAPTMPQVLPAIGEPAPSFDLPDSEGKFVRLADLKGTIVVLTWVHPACPETKAQFTRGPMYELPRLFEGENIKWLALNPLPPGEQFGGPDGAALAREQLRIKGPMLLDAAGVVTKAFGVTRSPTIAVIDAAGVLRYHGAIDNAPGGVVPEGEKRLTYLEDVLNALIDGKEIATTRTAPYGCEFAPKTPG
jgi:hypothetical protein